MSMFESEMFYHNKINNTAYHICSQKDPSINSSYPAQTSEYLKTNLSSTAKLLNCSSPIVDLKYVFILFRDEKVLSQEEVTAMV